MYVTLAVLAAFAFVYSVLAGRLDRALVNGPVVYLLFGVLAGPVVLGLVDLSIGGEGLRTIAGQRRSSDRGWRDLASCSVFGWSIAHDAPLLPPISFFRCWNCKHEWTTQFGVRFFRCQLDLLELVHLSPSAGPGSHSSSAASNRD